MQSQSEQPIHKVFTHEGAEREYFVYLPQNFDPNKFYWALVAAHGGGGDGRTFWMSDRLRYFADELGLEAIVIAPSFDKADPPAESFPLLGGISFLNSVIENTHQNYNLRPRILLTGYSRGGQFAHRFALWNPEKVEACVPCSSGSWTAPGGQLLISQMGEIEDPESFLLSEQNAEKAVKSVGTVAYLFNPRIAKIAGTPAEPGAQRIPFQIMCGNLDPRFESAQKFAESLESADYRVESAWPRTHHGGRNEEPYRTEFEKYPRNAVEFFLRVTAEKKIPKA